MANLEERVAVLEKELATMKAKVGSHDVDLANIPDLLRMEFRLMDSRIAKLSRDVSELSELPRKVEALPRVVAELVVEMLKERGKKS